MRRAVDLTVAVLAGVLALPLMIVTGVLVRLLLGRPVLFRQVRSGLGGEEFTLVKFRTMRVERSPGEPDAARTPRVGRFLRATSLDELPQLWNVVRGEMSLIGPRPTLPDQVARYSAHERRRLTVRPGLTGWAQVNGRNAISWPARIELDIFYIEHRSLRMDLLIVGRTLLRLIRPQGVTAAGGVNPGFPGPATPATDVPLPATEPLPRMRIPEPTRTPEPTRIPEPSRNAAEAPEPSR
ncbi:sugar transferase [Pseudonocardia nematodicida]|uniref:Sugar transferase n=1 Tax=Pseudonocardia nematodicida TaxID=1206997 RepID=A0ABV1K6X5_9PSEU